jgi:hypothetical protein
MVLVAFLFGLLQIFYLSTAVSQAQSTAERIAQLVAGRIVSGAPGSPLTCVAAYQAFSKATSGSPVWQIQFGYRTNGAFQALPLDDCMNNWSNVTAALVTLNLNRCEGVENCEVSGVMNPLFKGYSRPAPVQYLAKYENDSSTIIQY